MSIIQNKKKNKMNCPWIQFELGALQVQGDNNKTHRIFINIQYHIYEVERWHKERTK